MAKFAKLDENNVVIEVIALANEELMDDNGNEVEAKGVAFLTNWSGGHTNWVQTNVHSLIRKNYAAKNYIYDKNRDAFIPPKPFPSWTLNEEICQWNPPSPYPSTGIPYDWDEETVSWKPRESYSIIEETGRIINDLPVTTVGDSNA